MITSSQQNQSVQLKANPNFWRGPPKIGRLTYVSYKSTDAAAQALRTGDVDVVSGLTAAQFASLKGQPGIQTNAGAGRRYQALAINPGAVDAQGSPLGNGNPALKDKVLREAILTAIDNKTLLDRVLQGLGNPGETEIPPVIRSTTASPRVSPPAPSTRPGPTRCSTRPGMPRGLTASAPTSRASR